jgi:hypothetical protein
MNQNEIASLAEEVKSFVDESLVGIEGKIEARLAEAVELVNQINAKTELVSEHSELRNDDIDDLADALDMLTSQIAKIEAIEVKHGVDGKDGKDGSDGINGADGEKGEKGDAGLVGEKGIDGIDGLDGKDGSDGIDGVNGAKGEAGPQGADGADGSNGAGIDAPIYKAGVYREGSVVQANLGQYFKALQDTAENVDHESWERVGLNGFRMTGAFDEAKGYISGDLFIKDFGLFLSDGEESRLIAGRGPSGKRGEKGLAGKDGSPGADGIDGDTFDVMEVSGTNLVVVVRSGDGSVSTKSVDLSPVFDVASDITKSIEAKTESNVKAQFEAHAKGLLEYISEHISDQEAIPLRFFRGLYNTYNNYERGDTVVFGNVLYVTKEATSAIPSSIFEKDNPWSLVIGSSGGEGGDADLSGYVKRPSAVLRDGKWLLYRETTDGKREWTPATTDLIETNGMLMFRDSKGRFAPTPDELDELTNQLKVNRFLWDKIQALDVAGGVVISDQAPEKPENGMLWFDNNQDVMQLFIWHKDSDAWITVAPPTTLEGRVSQGEDTQKAIVAQIEKSLEDQAKIVAKVEELSITKGAVSRYTVKGTEINVATRNGELYVNSPNAADVTYISFAPFDSNGQTTKPTNPDDIIEFVEAVGARNAGDVTRYKAISGDSNALTVEYLSGANDFEVDESEEVYIYPQNQEGVSQDYVDQGLSSKLGNSGANQLPDDTDWKVKQQTSEGKNKTLIHSVGGSLGVYNLKEPVESHHAATKAYVDAKSSSNTGNGGVSASRPPGLKFMCSIVNLPNGYFQWWVKESTGNQHLELATTDRDGIAWGTNTPREDVRYSDNVPFTIWEVSGGGWKMKVTGTISRIDFHPDHALCYVSSKTALNGGNFANGSGPYYITISGIC